MPNLARYIRSQSKPILILFRKAESFYSYSISNWVLTLLFTLQKYISRRVLFGVHKNVANNSSFFEQKSQRFELCRAKISGIQIQPTFEGSFKIPIFLFAIRISRHSPQIGRKVLSKNLKAFLSMTLREKYASTCNRPNNTLHWVAFYIFSTTLQDQ